MDHNLFSPHAHWNTLETRVLIPPIEVSPEDDPQKAVLPYGGSPRSPGWNALVRTHPMPQIPVVPGQPIPSNCPGGSIRTLQDVEDLRGGEALELVKPGPTPLLAKWEGLALEG